MPAGKLRCEPRESVLHVLAESIDWLGPRFSENLNRQQDVEALLICPNLMVLLYLTKFY